MEQKKSYYDRCYEFKQEVMGKLQEVLGEKTADVSDYGYNVLVQEHIAGSQFEAELESISADGFVAEGEEYVLRDMNLDDLCIVLDRFISGEW